MSRPIPKDKLLYASTRQEWRAWLQEHYRTEDEVWLVNPRKHTGKPKIEYNDAVEEALCFGWIDSIIKTLDEDHSVQRYSVRKSKGSYSQQNRERLRWLIERDLVMPEVLEELPDLSEDDFEVPADILEAIKSNRAAWEHFQGFSDAYIRIRVAYIDGARRRPEEFEKRLRNFLNKTEQGKMFGHGGIEKYF